MSTRRVRKWRLRRPQRRDEHGAIAVIAGLLAVVLFGCAALAVDIASLVDKRQDLHNTLDTAALSGAMLLPDATAAKAQALAVAANNDPTASPDVAFFCIVGSKGSPPAVDPLSIPGSCNPGPAPYDAAHYPGLKCNKAICAIPCPSTQSCNAIQLVDDKDVSYSFAPVIGIDKGSTGSLSATSCKGGCGSPTLTPIDLAIIADRTSSMSADAFAAVQSGVQGMLKIFDPANTQVAFGMNSLSKTNAAGCVTAPATTNTDGQWFPISHSGSLLFKDYLVTGSNPPALNTSSLLVKGINCMTKSSTGTWLSAPIDAATELLTTDPSRNPAAKKAIVYMTDGEPNEGYTSAREPLGKRNVVTTTQKAWGNTTATSACTNAAQAATDAKAAGVTVVTIAYDVSTSMCGTKKLLDQLASMASPVNGVASTSNGCSTAALVAAENSDGDYFFCAAQPSDLASIFQTAAGSIAGGSKLMWMP